MTDQQHPITPPPELIAKWASSMCGYYEAARWGADQELEACCRWLAQEFPREQAVIRQLRAARRPKPPSLKDQALAALERSCFVNPKDGNIIRLALEQLDD